jgi:HSP20 family protein
VFERSYGAFQRAFALPRSVDPEKVNARFDNGVLEITLKKAKTAKMNGREIAVTAK